MCPKMCILDPLTIADNDGMKQAGMDEMTTQKWGVERAPAALDCWYLSGPTASGKTSIGLELAEMLDAEIVSLDSMAIYRGMDIGTAKPTTAQRERVPHHMLDLRDPNEEFSLSNYVEMAQQVVAEVRTRGRQVLFVGGTPLYLKGMLRGIFHGPPADWEFRREVEEEAEAVGLAALHQRLELVDPLSAEKLHVHDKRRIIRALEVYRLTGTPISHLQTQFDEATPAAECKVFVLSWPRPALHERINRRVDAMFRAGLVAEVDSIVAEFGDLSRTASQAVGYREVLDHIRRGCEMPETVEAVKTRTRQFARRQETWFRSLEECRFVPQDDETSEREMAERILNHVSP